MKRMVFCGFNMDTACVDLKFSDGSMISIDSIAVENEEEDNMYHNDHPALIELHHRETMIY